MDTLPRETWNGFFESKEHYLKLRARWAQLNTEPGQPRLSSGHYLLMSALRGRDWRRGLTPITNAKKLANGGAPGWRGHLALWEVHAGVNDCPGLRQVFDGLVTKEMHAAVCARLPKGSLYGTKMEFESAYLEVRDAAPGS